MKSKITYSLIISLILMLGHLTSVTAVTDAELDALEKQIEQQEMEEQKQAEADKKKKLDIEAKRQAEMKRKEEAKRIEEEQKRKIEEAKRMEEEQKRTTDNAKDAVPDDVLIETKFGNIEMILFPEVAPGHVESFLKLAKSGFYNGTIFHRIIPGFMIQGGDPNSKGTNRSNHGTGGPGYSIDAEFNDKPHIRGALSMARSRDPDSAGSQFFIVVKKSSFLDNQYTVFGEVISGMDVVDKIVSQERDARDNPIQRIEMTIRVTEPEKVEADSEEES